MRNILLIGIGCLGIIALIIVDRWQVRHWQAEKEIELNATVQLCQTRLENSIATRLDAIESLAALFILHPQTAQEEFGHFASLLIGTNPPIRALQYADADTRVTYVYPPKNNEITIKNPMLLAADPIRGPYVKRAIAKKRASLQGPFELRQGGMGIVVRLPFFKAENFAGMAIGIYDVPVLVKEALEGLNLDQFVFRITDHEGTVFWGAREIPFGFHTRTVSVADTQWAISVNWKNPSLGPPALPRALVWFCGTGFLLSAIIIIQLLWAQTRRLESIINQRTKDLYRLNTDLADKIVQHKGAERALKESEERFELAMQSANDGLYDMNLLTDVVYYSPVWKSMLGYGEDEIKSDVAQWERLTKEEDVKATREMLNEVLEGKRERLEIEFQMLHKKGYWVDILSRARAVFDQNGNATRVVGTHVDITQSKWEFRLSTARADISRELISQKHDIKKISDLTRKYALELTQSRDGFVATIENLVGEKFGHALNGMGRDQCRIDDQHPKFSVDISGHYNALWGHALNIKKAFYTNLPERHESAKGVPEGHIPLKNFLAVPVLIGGHPAGLIAMANSTFDYSEKELRAVQSLADIYALALYRNRYELERASMESKLRQLQRLEALGTLAGGIAHDFNNILFPIVGRSELLLDDLAPDSPEWESAEEIFKAANRGSDLVKQILAFSRQSDDRKKPVWIQQILDEVLNLGRRTIPSNIDIRQDIQTDCGMVMADPTQVHQIAMNLITNAYHAIELSGGTISVRLNEKEVREDNVPDSLLGRGRYAVLSVSDNGGGIDPAVMDKLFEPYFTTKPQGKGTGLGLSVVYGIVKGCQGDIKVDSEVGKGTTFNVYLPVMDEPIGTDVVEISDKNPTGMERVLLVDDEAPIVKLVTKMLERLGYQVQSSVNCVDALETFRADPDAFDLVLTDMSMPRMAGDQLAKQLVSIRPDIPIIICTGFSERLNRSMAEAIGIKGFLMKPVIQSEMARTVRNVLDEAIKSRDR